MEEDKIAAALLDETNLGGSEKSSHWTFHTKDFSCSKDVEGLGIDGFGTFSKRSALKQLLHKIFQRFLFSSFKKVFTSGWYKSVDEICRMQGRALNCDAFLHACVFDFIFKKVSFSNAVVCSIGDGMSNFVAPAYASSDHFRHIISVNLPEVLLSDYLLMRRGGMAKDQFKYVCQESELTDALSSKERKIILLPARNKRFLLNKGIDLFFNITSFQEMNHDLVQQYFEIIKSNHAYLYCCNREDKTLYGGERLVFDNYPWGSCEKIVWEDCPWHQRFYSFRPPFILKYDGNVKHALVKYNRSV